MLKYIGLRIPYWMLRDPLRDPHVHSILLSQKIPPDPKSPWSTSSKKSAGKNFTLGV
jgi:hypothetical protein